MPGTRTLNEIVMIALGVVATVCFGTEVTDLQQRELAELVQQLSSDSFRSREEASLRLARHGEWALPVLRRVMAHTVDVEVHFRARQAIRGIIYNVRDSKSTGLKMAVMLEGTFFMGSPANERDRQDEEKLHAVRFASPYLIGVQEVTQSQFQQVMGHEPSYFSPSGEGAAKIPGLDTASFPVEQVSWFDAIDFCNRLSELDGYAKFYEMKNVKRAGESIVSADVQLVGGSGYRLPTEAEWEYACRASTDTPYHFGSQASTKYANLKPRPRTVYGSEVSTKTFDRTTAVGSFQPNLWQLHDMHGNVAEWCWDWYGQEYYGDSPNLNPLGPASGHHRVVRGGSWLVQESNCRSASRFHLAPSECKFFAGFRVARSP